jgi:RNA polymerase sigma-70 factor (ECF subfamily)
VIVEEGDFTTLVAELRPRLHRYCARMTGSVITGEDVLQDALVKAIGAVRRGETATNPTGWLFRIAHNAALDFLRYEARRETASLDEGFDMIDDREDETPDPHALAAGLHTFMRLPPAQRSAVILKDVLTYSIQEISDIAGGTTPSIKSALQRGRARLRELGTKPDEAPQQLDGPTRARLELYVERFTAHDFGAVRAMLADDVRLDLVNRVQLRGRTDVSEYFHRYASAGGWHFTAGIVEGRPAILAVDAAEPDGPPAFFILLEWADGAVVTIRDFLFARYVMDGADWRCLLRGASGLGDHERDGDREELPPGPPGPPWT